MQTVTGLRIRLLGGLLLESGGRILPRIPSRPGRSLFAYLVLHRDRELARDLLAGTFWPDLPDNQARRRLSQSLWQIQTLLAESGVTESYIVATSSSVRFDPRSDFWLDVEEFEAATALLKEGRDDDLRDVTRLEDAAELYRGDLLAGFYDDWLLVDQQRYRERYFSLLAFLANLHKSRGDFDRAVVFARRLALHDPLREEAHREVMRLCFLAGRANEALLQYEVCYSALQDELGVEPQPATTELFESIAAQRRSGAVVSTARSPLMDDRSALPLIGRETPRSMVVSLLEAALGGSGGVVLVEGEPGVGKTRFLEAIADDAAWRGMGTLWGTTSADGAHRSYEAISSALLGGLSRLQVEQLAVQVEPVWLQEVARLVPQVSEWLPTGRPGSELGAADDSRRMLEAIVRTLAGLSRFTPQVLIVDDVHWADDDTLVAIEQIAKRVGDVPVVICLAFRGQVARQHRRVWDLVRGLDAAPSTLRIGLDPLSGEETAKLVRAAGGSVDAALVERIHEETGGNPLFIIETLRAMLEHQIASAGVATSDIDVDFPLPPTVLDLISARVAALDASVRDALLVFSVCGVEFDLELALCAADRPRPELIESAELLVQRGILTRRGDRYRFRHQQVQRVALSDADEKQRRACHEQVARCLMKVAPAEPEPIARHFLEAERWGEAVAFSERAAERALDMRALASAARHYEIALEHAERAGCPAEDHLRLLGGYERVLDVLGRREDQARVLDEMSARGGDGPEIARRRAWQLAHTDRFTEAAAAAADALAMDEASGSERGVMEDQIVLGRIALWSGEAATAVTHLEEAVETGADRTLLADARQSLGSALCDLQLYERAEKEAGAALALYEEESDGRGRSEALGLLGIITMERGRAAEAVGYYRRAIELCREIGYRHGEGVNLVNLGNALWYAGRVSEALEHFTAAMNHFASMGNRRGTAVAQINAGAIHHGLLGDDETATSYSQSAVDYYREVGNESGAAPGLLNLARIAQRAGDLEAAERHLSEGLAAVESSGNRYLRAQLLDALALLALAEGNAGRALSLAQEGLSLCRDVGIPDFEASLLSAQALALVQLGRPEEAVQAASDAADRIQSGSDRAYLVAHRQGLVLEACGEIGQAARAFQRADELLRAALDGVAEELRPQAYDVPEHRAITDSFERTSQRSVEVVLAARDAPTGRPLRDDERRNVVWTIAAPVDHAIAEGGDRRRHRLRRLLAEAKAQGGAPTVDDLAAVLGVAVTTVRRDLQALRREGVEVATRGSRRPQ